MLILCSPSNPTGSVYTKQELEALAAVIKQHKDLFVLADEIYEHINYVGAHASIAQVEGMKEQTIIANGVNISVKIFIGCTNAHFTFTPVISFKITVV